MDTYLLTYSISLITCDPHVSCNKETVWFLRKNIYKMRFIKYPMTHVMRKLNNIHYLVGNHIMNNYINKSQSHSNSLNSMPLT